MTTYSPVSNRSVRAEVSLRAISNWLRDLGDLFQLLHIQLTTPPCYCVLGYVIPIHSALVRHNATQFDTFDAFLRLSNAGPMTTYSPVSNRSIRAEVSLRAISNWLRDFGDLFQLLHIELDTQTGPVIRV
jgi:hypothetical protein